MRHALVLVLVVVLLAGCGTSGNTGSSGTSRSSAAPPAGRSNIDPEDIRPVEDPVVVSWVALKRAVGRRGDVKNTTRHMHLINRAHPDSRKPIPLDAFKKVLSNAQMGALLALLEERGFDRLGRAGVDPDRIPAGTANGAIVVRRGGRVKSLVFEKGMRGDTSPVPEAYRECQEIILGIFNKADQPQVYVPEDERVLGIERLK